MKADTWIIAAGGGVYYAAHFLKGMPCGEVYDPRGIRTRCCHWHTDNELTRADAVREVDRLNARQACGQ